MAQAAASAETSASAEKSTSAESSTSAGHACPQSHLRARMGRLMFPGSVTLRLVPCQPSLKIESRTADPGPIGSVRDERVLPMRLRAVIFAATAVLGAF